MTKQDGDHSNAYYPPLPVIEILHYVATYSFIIIWSIATLFQVSKDNEPKYAAYDYVEAGWRNWIGRHKDTSDFEWAFWERYYYTAVIAGLLGHFIVARIADATYPQYRFKIYCVYSAMFSRYFLGPYGLIYIIGHFFVQYCVAVFFKSIIACWISGCLLAYSLTNPTCVSLLKDFYPEDEYKAYFVLFTTAMCNLRYLSFSIEYVWHTHSIVRSALEDDKSNDSTSSGSVVQDCEKKNLGFFRRILKICTNKTSKSLSVANDTIHFTFVDMLVYQMYFPLFYGGPVMNYNDFSCQLQRPPTVWNFRSISNFILGTAKFILWHIITNVLLHFFYISAISSEFALVVKLPLVSLLGLGLGLVIFFCLKYVCMYGLMSFFSVSDNLDVPGPPHCIFVKHRVTDMWKYFDKGLHSWLLRYIYIPSGGSRVGQLRSVLNTMLPFLFVCFWHGATHGQRYWACLSWLGVYLENVALKLYKTDEVRTLEDKYCNVSWSRRLRAILSAPLLSLLLVSNLFFLCRVDVALLFCKRIYLESFSFTAILLLFFYCGCQTSMELHRIGV